MPDEISLVAVPESLRHGREVMYDFSHTSPLFGRAAKEYGSVVQGILPRLRPFEYLFIDNDSMLDAVNAGRLSAEEVNRIVVLELLTSAHLAAHTSIIRAQRWTDSTWREYEARNYLGWAACCRAFLEAIGDTALSLRKTAAHIALNIDLFRRAIDGLDEGIVRPKEIEDELIHFSHARKLSKSEKQTEHESHSAKQTTEYIRILETVGMRKAAEMYSELCQIAHPARASLDWQYVRTEIGFLVLEEQDERAIKALVSRYRETIHGLIPVAFNPGLLIFRVLVKFKLFPLLPELKRFRFNEAEAWHNLEPMLRN